jgi:hypothetical protein
VDFSSRFSKQREGAKAPRSTDAIDQIVLNLLSNLTDWLALPILLVSFI